MLFMQVFRSKLSTVIILFLCLSACSNEPNKLLYEKLSKLAEQGNAAAQYNVGMMLNNGIGSKQDLSKAFAWFQKSAATGDPLAAYKVGCYLGGQFSSVVPVDEQQSFEHKLIAANAGYDLAQHDVGVLYYKKQKFEEASHWWKLSAEQGSDSSLFALSSLYQEGKGVPRDNMLAYKYFMLGKVVSEQEVPKEAQMNIDQLIVNISPEQLKEVKAAITTWKPRPTALTIRAHDGIKAARKLVDLNVE